MKSIKIIQSVVFAFLLHLSEASVLSDEDLADVHEIVNDLKLQVIEVQRENVQLKHQVSEMTRQVFKASEGFTALNFERETYNDGDTIIFESTSHNTGRYDSGTGIFTCPASGTYMFSLSFATASESNSDYCITVGTNEVGCSHSTDGSGSNVGSTTVVVPCAATTQVKVIATRDGTTTYGAILEKPVCTFSGVLLSLDP